MMMMMIMMMMIMMMMMMRHTPPGDFRDQHEKQTSDVIQACHVRSHVRSSAVSGSLNRADSSSETQTAPMQGTDIESPACDCTCLGTPLRA